MSLTHAESAQAAVALVRPSIDALLAQTVRPTVHIVVMDPRLKPWEATFADAVLYQETIGDSASWEKPFDDFARNKAEQAWRSGRPNVVNQTQHPSSLRQGDLPFYGSFVYGDIIVGCSGVEQWFDMLISGWVALAMEQLIVHEGQGGTWTAK